MMPPSLPPKQKHKYNQDTQSNTQLNTNWDDGNTWFFGFVHCQKMYNVCLLYCKLQRTSTTFLVFDAIHSWIQAKKDVHFVNGAFLLSSNIVKCPWLTLSLAVKITSWFKIHVFLYLLRLILSEL